MSESLRIPDTLTLLEHRAWVRGLARRLLADENEVDDVEQETWTAALRAGPDEPRALRSWLGAVASRFALQRLRGERRRAARDDVLAAAARTSRPTADVVAEADAHGHVVQAVLALREPYRTTVILRYFEGLAVADVAARMEVPVETARTRLRRAHEILRGALERDHRRSLSALLAPIGAAAGLDAPVPPVTPVAPLPPMSLGLGASLAGAAGVTAVVVGAVALGAWALSGDGDAGSGAPVAAAPQDGGGGGAGGGKDGGGPGERGGAGESDEAARRSREGRADAPPAAPPAATGADAWIAYDLADGKPIPGLSLRIRTDAGDSVAVTDGAGRLDVDRASVVEVTAGDGGTWKLALPRNGAVRDEPSLWFWRERGVTGTVVAANPERKLAAEAVEVTWTVVGSDPLLDAGTPGSGRAWLHSRDLGPRHERADVTVDATGRLKGRVPAIRGLWLTAQAADFAPAAQAPVWPAEGDSVVRFELSDTIRIVGRLREENGDPVIGAVLSIDSSVAIRDSAEGMRYAAKRPRGGFGMGVGADGGTVFFSDSVRTDVRGIFRAEIAPLGPGSSVALYYLRPGSLACRVDLGALDRPGDPIELTVVPSTVRVELRDRGIPLVSASVVLQVADTRENGFALTTDENGRADAGWLQRGRWYRVTCPRAGAGETDRINGCFLWDGRTTIDLDTLPDKPPKTR